MTSSSSPGVSLMSEAMSYIAGQELPVVVVNVMRGGPGLGGILPSQGDYNQATCGMGHGDFNIIVYAPSSLQEAVDMVQRAFDTAQKYRHHRTDNGGRGDTGAGAEESLKSGGVGRRIHERARAAQYSTEPFSHTRGAGKA